eukprot:scaffold85_cov175-Ochromonas_danica.AAC.19
MSCMTAHPIDWRMDSAGICDPRGSLLITSDNASKYSCCVVLFARSVRIHRQKGEGKERMN